MSWEARYRGRPEAVRFLERPNRYLSLVEFLRTGTRVLAHVPNPGRMEELLVEGETEGWVIPCDAPRDRKTRYDFVAVNDGPTCVSIDSRIANRLVARVVGAAGLPRFRRRAWSPEVTWDGSRWDFARRENGALRELLEVKSSNLRVGTTALFPDAPTVRGAHHLDGLSRAALHGLSAHLLVMIQRDDVRAFVPNAELDPNFARAFDRARRTGVSVEARTMHVAPDGVSWGERVPVRARLR